ncbi:hypothetical protein KPH14_005222 [Odynerus spinipes]|uniref:Uncharacterized protein n=1 Tax=Odynerus spinipes TaxID=1348599 RepID=A0AAD9RCK6_9HYME|nr:hypothetical protein KPH14_005222 [Odynerus spinipes]
MAHSGYTSPECFTQLDRMGLIQNANNTPVIYHVKRHCTNKAVNTDADNDDRSNWVYSTTLSDSDRNDLDRLSKAYWWLQREAKFMDELRRRARIKQRQQQNID